MCGSTSVQSEDPSSPTGTSEPDKDGAVLRQYYNERDYLTSPEGIMKVISIVLCIVLSGMLLSVSCGATPLRTAGATLELVSAAALACLYAVRLLQLVLYAPMCCFYADLIVSTTIGIVLLVTAVLSLTICDIVLVGDYIHGPLGVLNAGIATGSAVVTYVSVTRRWDAAASSSSEVMARSSPLQPSEQEV